MYGEITNNGFKIIGSLKDCQRVADFVDALAHFEGYVLLYQYRLTCENESPSLVAYWLMAGPAPLP